MDDRTVAQIAPSGDFGNTTTINCDNPLLSAQQRALVCAAGQFDRRPTARRSASRRRARRRRQVFIDPITGTPYNRGFLQILRRNVEGGGRRDDLQHTSYRIVAGMNGQLNDAWSYDMYYQFGQTNFAETYSNDFSVRRLGLALDVVDDPATAGVDPICRSAQGGTGAATRAASPGTSSRRQRHPGRPHLSADSGPPARRHPAEHRQRLGHRRPRHVGDEVPVGEQRHRHRRRRRVSPRDARAARRPGLLDAALVRPCRPGRADPSGRGRLRRQGSVRRGPHPDRRGQLLLQPLARRRLPLFGLRHRRPARSAPTPTRWRSTSRRSATSASAPPTTARSGRRTSRSCSRRSASRSTAAPIRARAHVITAGAADAGCRAAGPGGVGQYGTSGRTRPRSITA